MRCYNGIEANGTRVPCGQCMNCRVNQGRIWTSRILMEQLTCAQRSWFLTLTFNDDHVPVTPEYDQTLRKQEFLDWRKATARSIAPFRYYAVGEYGDLSGRPHYHVAVFPRDDSPIERITDAWEFGFTSAYELTDERARYLAQYTTKKLTKADDDRLLPGQEPEFRVSSRVPGLGAPCVPAIVSQYRTGAGAKIVAERGDVERNIRFAGKIYPIAPFILEKVRRELGIPVLHRDRLCHPGYYEWHQLQETEYCPATFLAEEDLRAEEKRRQVYRSTTSRV